MIPHMCRLVLMSDFYEELSVPTLHSRNAYFFITRLHIIRQKPKFRQRYFLVNIKNMKLHILRHILVPVSDGTGGQTGYHHKSPRLQIVEVQKMCQITHYRGRKGLKTSFQWFTLWYGISCRFLVCCPIL